MSRIDYDAIKDGVKTTLEADAALSGVTIVIEEEFTFADSPWIGIYLERRQAPADDQNLRAGQATRYQISLQLWCMEWSLDSLKVARKLSEDLAGKAEVALMKDRTLNASVDTFWLEGGEFGGGRDADTRHFLAATEIVLIAKAETNTS